MPNYSIYSILGYVTLTFVPHVHSVYYLANHSQRRDNTNPRGSKFASNLNKSLPPQVLAKYERLRAAHSNMLENMAFFIGAVLSGVITNLDADFMNRWLATYLATRVVYLLSYSTTEKWRWSLLRSVLYTAGGLVLGGIYVKAGQKLVAGTK